MKKIVGLFAFLFFGATLAGAQDASNDKETKKTIVKPSRDFVMIQLTYDGWSGTPDHVKVGGLGRGFSAYLCYDFPINNSNFSFAAGLGVTSNNIYFKDQLAVMNMKSDSIQFVNVSGDDYKKSKLSTTYLEAPFELRLFGNKDNRNRGFKASLGMKVGLLLGAHSKNKNTLTGSAIVEKTNSTRYIQAWRFAPTARIGWGNFYATGSYSLSPLFHNGQGPEVYPFSIGIGISGL